MKTPSYLQIKNGNERCVIVFSSFAARDYGPLAYSYKGHFEKHASSCDLIFVKDTKNQWYNRALPGLGENVAEIADSLRELTKYYRNISTFGSSMGGYASILYGGLLDVAHVVALSPQTMLQEPFPRYSKRIHSGSYFDLSKLSFAGNPRCTIIVGEEELFDIYQVNLLRSKQGIEFSIVPTAAHNVVKLLDDRGDLDAVIEEICSGVEIGCIERLLGDFRTKARIQEGLAEPEFGAVLSSAIETYYRDRVAALPHLQRVLLLMPDWLGAMSKLGMSNYAAGNLSEALALFRAVSAQSSTIDEFYLTYASCLATAGEAERAIEVAAKAARIEPSNKTVFLSVAEILDGLHLVAAANVCRERWSRIK